jgi:hypothetical protein
MKSKRPNRVPGLSIYLGPEPERSRRLEAIKRMAGQLDITTSEMFRRLADGQLTLLDGKVVVAPEPGEAK